MCLITLRWSRNIIKYNFNILNTMYSVACTSALYVGKHNTCFRTSSDNDGSMLHSFTNVTPFKINSRLIFTSCVMTKGREKGDKKKCGKAQHIDLNESREVLNIDKFTAQMDHALEELRNNFMKHLTLRSSAGAIEQVVVKFEGEEYILQDLVQIVHKPKMVVLNAIAFPQAIPQILKALSDSKMNLNPQQDGTTLFISIPKITKEHREGLAKNAKALYIKCRDNVKDMKNKELKILKKIPSISEDKVRRIQAQLEALCDEYIKKAESILDVKQKELLRTSD